MTALRQEALQIVNAIPDNLLAAFVQYLKNFKPDKKISIDDLEVDPKKAAAFAAMEELRVRNRKYLKGTDLEQEYLEAIDEKFGNPH